MKNKLKNVPTYQNPARPLDRYDTELESKRKLIEQGKNFSASRDSYVNEKITSNPESKFAIKHTLGNSMPITKNKNLTWLEKRAESRPDLVTPEQLQEAKNQMNSVSVVKTSTLQNRGKMYAANTLPKWVESDNDRQMYNEYALGDLNIENAVKQGVDPDQIKWGINKAYKNETWKGMYYPTRHSIVVNDLHPQHSNSDYPSVNSTLDHEYAHTYDHLFQPQVADIIRKHNAGKDKYLDSAGEIYARLQQLRNTYNIDPAKKYTLDDVKQLKLRIEDWGNSTKQQTHSFDILNRYSDEMIMDLLNNVAAVPKVLNNRRDRNA